MRHGAKVKRCSCNGCTNQALKGGVCIRHGTKIKRCSSHECTKFAQNGGLCYRHGTKIKKAAKRKRGTSQKSDEASDNQENDEKLDDGDSPILLFYEVMGKMALEKATAKRKKMKH
jgi:hypothetical protein